MNDQDKAKRMAAAEAVKLIRPDMRLGLGTGSTADFFIDLLCEKVRKREKKERWDIQCVASSKASEERVRAAGFSVNLKTGMDMRESLGSPQGITLRELSEVPHLDLTVDGADELTQNLELIKGGGGALLRERELAVASARMVVIADASKQVARLGAFPLPIEVAKDAHEACAAALQAALQIDASKQTLRGGNAPFTTERGNVIYDHALGAIDDPPATAAQIEKIKGVQAHGLFLGLATGAIISDGAEVWTIGSLE